MSKKQIPEEIQSILRGLQNSEPIVSSRSLAQIGNLKKQSQILQQPSTFSLFSPVKYDVHHQKLMKELEFLKEQSQKIYKLGEFLKDDENKLKNFKDKKQELLLLIQELQGSTSTMVAQQKKAIQLSVAIKEAKQYYQFLDKFQFQYVCDASHRQIFENHLLPTLSQLTDGIYFFTNKPTYINASKYLKAYINTRLRVASFSKSFLIKLLNKQHSFAQKYHPNNKISIHFQTMFPKSRSEFVLDYLIIFPQFKDIIRDNLLNAKESTKQSEVKLILQKQSQVESFLFNENTFSLIKYFQQNIPDNYQEAILKFLTYYRGASHENMIKIYKLENSNETFEETFKRSLNFTAYLLSSQLCYFYHCTRMNPQQSEPIKTNIRSYSDYYFRMLLRNVKDPKKNKHPFKICEILKSFLGQFQQFLRKSALQDYKNYTFATVYTTILGYLATQDQKQQFYDFLINLMKSFLSKMLTQLQSICQHNLPKINFVSTQKQTTQLILQFLNIVPDLQYCPSFAQKYIIGSLDVIIKSVREANNKFQSRFECYVWNIDIFFTMREVIENVKLDLVSKEIKLDFNETRTIFQKISNINNRQGILNYAQNIFSILKTGMPTLNELTLDFSKYIRQHFSQLSNRFLKDITFIYGKNIIQLLQKLNSNSFNQTQKKAICQQNLIKPLYSGYLISIESFTRQSKKILRERALLKITNKSINNIKQLMKQVYENLFQLISQFYIEVSKIVDYTQQFQDIQAIRAKLPLNLDQMNSQNDQ